MPSAAPISDTVLRDLVNKAMSDVLITMLALNSRLVWVSDDHPGAEPPPLSQNSPLVVGAVGFIGDINGLIYLHLESEFAKLVTCKLVGLSPEEIESEGDEVVNDAIGELTNMIAGAAKAQLAKYELSISLPNVIAGHKYVMHSPSDVQPMILSFNSEIGPFWIEVAFTGF